MSFADGPERGLIRVMIVLGIVGTPAGGKSTIAEYLAELGATWINADLIARAVMEEAGIQADLINHFGPRIRGKDGRIDRLKLSSIVFGDDDSSRSRLEYLENLIHPRTRRLIKDQLITSQQRGDAVAILDVPLLFKSGWDCSCDEIWCVDADQDLRIRRVVTRGWDSSQLRAREKNQLEIEQKKRLSTHVILNNGTIADLGGTINVLWSSLLDTHASTTDQGHCLQQDISKHADNTTRN